MRSFKIAALAFVAAAILAGCTERAMEAPAKPEPRPAASVSLPDLAGRMVSIGQFKGKPLIVNFWASWCAPCIAEMPQFEKVYNTWKSKGLEVLAINMKEPKDIASKFMEDNGYSFTTLLDESGEATDKFQVFGLPTTFFVDREGIIRYSHMGQITPEIILAGLESIELTDI